MDMIQFFPVLVVGFATSLGLTPLSRQIAMRLGVVDKPNARKIHFDHKPMMGGLAIYSGFVLALLLFSPPQHFVQLGAVLAGGTLVAIIGLLDDRYTLDPGPRFAVMTVAAIGAVASGIVFQFTGLPFIDYPLTIFWIVAITNALNFLDNMDGLSAGLSSIAAFFFLLIALAQSLSLVSLLAAGLLGSAVGFLIYNFAPSSTFMGDMGALLLGFVLAVLGIKLDTVVGMVSPQWFVPLLILAPIAFDINLVIFTRALERRSILQAGKDHTSHRLLAMGLSHRQTLFMMYLGAFFFGLAGLAVMLAPAALGWAIVGACALIVALLYVVMAQIRRNYQLT